MRLAGSCEYNSVISMHASAVIGPLVVAGVSMPEKDLPKLKALGVRDSKDLSPRRRRFLAKRIEEVVKDVMVLKTGACKIDNLRKEGVNLNKIEAIKFAEIVDFLGGDKAYIDAPENPEKLTLFIKNMIKGNPKIIAEHKADVKYPIVSAASIIAKVERDQEIEELKKKYGDIGPGYPSNDITMAWLRNWLKSHKDFPEIVRKTWDTIRVLKGQKKQSKLAKWFGGKKEEECKGK